MNVKQINYIRYIASYTLQYFKYVFTAEQFFQSV